MAKPNEFVYSLLTDTYHLLMAFYSNSQVPIDADGVSADKMWIIDADEKRAIEVVLDVLKDCGADTKAPE